MWEKANPNLEVSLSRDYLRRECRKAVELPRLENTFKRAHLNQWTESSVRWLDMDRWDATADEPVDEAALVGCECFAVPRPRTLP